MAATEHLHPHHSLRSEHKREAVLSAARAMLRAGIQVGELQAQLDQREREILALRDSLRQTIRERKTGT